MENLFMRFSNGWVLILSFVALVACLFGFNGVIERWGGHPMLDLSFGYDMEQVRTAMLAYGAEGRALYARAALTLDIVFPLAYGTFLIALLMRYRLHRLAYLVVWVVIAGVLVDVAENTQLARLLVNYPDISAQAVMYASTTTQLKWVLVRSAQFFALLQLAIIALKLFDDGALKWLSANRKG